MFECPVCHKFFLSTQALGGHLAAKHPKVDSDSMILLLEAHSKILQSLMDWQKDQARKVNQLLNLLAKVDLESHDRDSELHGIIDALQDAVIGVLGPVAMLKDSREVKNNA